MRDPWNIPAMEQVFRERFGDRCPARKATATGLRSAAAKTVYRCSLARLLIAGDEKIGTIDSKMLPALG